MVKGSYNFDQLKNPLQLPFYYLGFHPYQTIGIMTVGLGIVGHYVSDSGVAWGTFGFFLISPIVWLVSVFVVNSNYAELIEAFKDDVAEKATQIFAGGGQQTNTYQIEHSYDSVNFVQPKRVHEPITLITGESSLLIYDDAKLQLDLLQVNLGTSTREVYFDSVTSVNYDKPFFELRLSNGERIKHRSSRKPDDVLHELQQKIRNFKGA